MAVQAQYPSNVLLLNRNGQDGHEFSLQPQATGAFLDQSHLLFSSAGGGGGGDNLRKRGREVAAAPGNATAIAVPMNSYSMQTQQPQLIELSQLHQPNVVSTGLRLAFGDQQQQQNLNRQLQQQHNIVGHSSSLLSLLSDDFTVQIKRQREELDQFLQSQGEQLRRALAEKRQRHYRALLTAAEESVARRLREKEAEVEKATRRNAELEARAAQLSVEAQVWQAKARAQEATAATLQAQLQQAIMSSGGAAAMDGRKGEDGMKCGGGEAEDAESAYVDPERIVGPACRACRTRGATVVLLPCRHLCLCTECDRMAQACPLCLTVRNSSVEVFLS